MKQYLAKGDILIFVKRLSFWGSICINGFELV